MNPSLQVRKKKNESTAKTNEENVSSEDEEQNILMVCENITFVASSKKRKIDDIPEKSKESSSIISGSEFAEEMGLIAQPPLGPMKKSSQTGRSVSTSVDGGDVSTVDYNLSAVDLQPSEALPPNKLPF